MSRNSKSKYASLLYDGTMITLLALMFAIFSHFLSEMVSVNKKQQKTSQELVDLVNAMDNQLDSTSVILQIPKTRQIVLRSIEKQMYGHAHTHIDGLINELSDHCARLNYLVNKKPPKLKRHLHDALADAYRVKASIFLYQNNEVGFLECAEGIHNISAAELDILSESSLLKRKEHWQEYSLRGFYHSYWPSQNWKKSITKAIEYWEKSWALNPTYTNTDANNLAEAYLVIGNFHLARHYAQQHQMKQPLADSTLLSEFIIEFVDFTEDSKDEGNNIRYFLEKLANARKNDKLNFFYSCILLRKLKLNLEKHLNNNTDYVSESGYTLPKRKLNAAIKHIDAFIKLVTKKPKTCECSEN